MAAATAFLPSSLFAGQIKSARNARIAKFAPRVQARFSFGKKKAKPAPPPPKRGQSVGRPMWLPGSKPPEWLDGSLVGDYGFDPLGLGKPAEYLQYELDSLDQNLAKNQAGDVIGMIIPDEEIRPTAFKPYSEAFSLQRFRECEVIHGRWAMLGVLGALAVEAFTGVYWQDAGKVELVEGSSYFGLPLPFNITSLIWIEVLLVGYIEFQRNAELDPELRLYPGGKYFDPFGLAADPERKDRLKLAEIKHARLAMVAFLIFGLQALYTGKGPLTLFVELLGKK